MAIRNVVTEGDEILRKHCKEVKEITPRLKETLQDMLETMRESMGVGIAGPQVGVMRRIFVAQPDPYDEEKVYFMINPVMLEMSDEKELGIEGFDARVMQHEYDHLDGILYTDKCSNLREAALDEEEYDEFDEEE